MTALAIAAEHFAPAPDQGPVPPRMLTGDRPTGRLHLGHYAGSLVNRIRLHRRYQSFFIVADLHMLTTRNSRDDIGEVGQRAADMVLDSLAAGLDPDHSVFYLQSGVPEVAELSLLLSSLVTVPRLQRIPSLKEMARHAGQREMPLALLGYPVLQAADILAVKATAVPVGRDNAAHVEVARELARRFNRRYGAVFPVPALVRADVPALPGTDGRAKMSKSLGNAIYLSDPPDEVAAKVRRMYTDPARTSPSVPGTVEGNPVFTYHEVFNDRPAEVAGLKERYRAGKVSDAEVKEKLTAALNRFLDPIRERRAALATDQGLVEELIVKGTELTRHEVRRTVAEVRAAMGLTTALAGFRAAARARAR
jgi:tryptophanyl-tRNA synthetase